MKRIVTLALAAGLFMGATATAEAVEVSVDGKFTIAAFGFNGLNFKEDTAGDQGTTNSGFDVWQRVQIGLDFVASETLKGRFMFRAPNENLWGDTGYTIGGSRANNTQNFQVKEAYIDWIIPTTDVSVRMGQQYFNSPYMLGSGSAFIDDYGVGVTVNAPINEMVELNAYWARLDTGDTSGTDGNGDGILATDDGYADLFMVDANIMLDGMTFVPYFAFATVGSQASSLGGYSGGAYANPFASDFDAYYAGLNTNFTIFDPLTITADFLYSWADGHNGNAAQASAWMADLALSYNTGNGAVSLYGWYATGDDKEDVAKNEYGRIVKYSSGWGTTKSAFFDQAAFGVGPTTGVNTPTGTWAIGLEYDGYRPIEDLSLGAHVLWINGTNDSDLFGKTTANNQINAEYMSTEDSVIDISAWAIYDIYKELKVCFDVSYLIANFEEDNYVSEEEDGFRAGVSFVYSF